MMTSASPVQRRGLRRRGWLSPAEMGQCGEIARGRTRGRTSAAAADGRRGSGGAPHEGASQLAQRRRARSTSGRRCSPTSAAGQPQRARGRARTAPSPVKWRQQVILCDGSKFSKPRPPHSAVRGKPRRVICCCDACSRSSSSTRACWAHALVALSYCPLRRREQLPPTGTSLPSQFVKVPPSA